MFFILLTFRCAICLVFVNVCHACHCHKPLSFSKCSTEHISNALIRWSHKTANSRPADTAWGKVWFYAEHGTGVYYCTRPLSSAVRKAWDCPRCAAAGQISFSTSGTISFVNISPACHCHMPPSSVKTSVCFLCFTANIHLLTSVDRTEVLWLLQSYHDIITRYAMKKCYIFRRCSYNCMFRQK